jgi:acetylornithine/succinyldiaminopimelate/putrescine aminotransferase/predicted amino acid dehydrogenase
MGSDSAGKVDSALHFKPRLTQLLRTLRLDVTYTRAAGNFLYYRDEANKEVEVLDLVGGYGSLLLGHSHPSLVAEAQRLLAAGQPIHAQGSVRRYAAKLAAELSRRAQGDFCVVFANSGAEAVETAMKHAMLETGGRTFLALDRAFHGKTLGAVQLTANQQYRDAFELPGLNVVRVPLNNGEQLEAALARTPNVAGFIFEPIQGEGGIRGMDPAFGQLAAKLCAERGVPLIADECQTGLGRTGAFLASDELGIKPDYIILSKALGGGLAKISASLIRRARYVEEFDLKHTSTYADDDFSCAIALKTLELIDGPLIENCRANGERLLSGLRRLAQKYPTIIAGVRGRGLMVGVEFCRLTQSPSFLLRFLTAQADLGFILMGYLLNIHHIRAAPTLSDRFTLRLEPSALIAAHQINRVLCAFEDICVRLQSDDSVGLTSFLIEGCSSAGTAPTHPSPLTGGELLRTAALLSPAEQVGGGSMAGGQVHPQQMVHHDPTSARSDGKFFAFNESRFWRRERSSPPVRVAWLCHLIDADDLVSLEPPFEQFSLEQRETYLGQLVERSSPVVMSAVDVRSVTGGMVRLQAIMLPFTSRWVKRLLDERRLALPQALVQKGVDLARSLDCGVVALGQFTSIVTLNGTRVDRRGMGITTGNSYAIALAIQAIERAQRERGTDSCGSTLAIAGAAGNIGRTCAEILASRYRRTILLGSDKAGSRLRLAELAQRLPNTGMAPDRHALRDADVVVIALNAVDAPLESEHFGHGSIVCDLSVPGGVQSTTAAIRSDLLIIKGGIARLPFSDDLEITGFPLPAGQTYGCMAEGILLGLEGIRDTTFTGSLSAEHVRRVTAMAQRHGFELADYKKTCVFGSQRRDQAYVNAD